MIGLDANDKFLINKFFNTGGYVMDFSTPAFDSFCFQTVGVKICEKYGLSKGKSLASFIEEYPTSISMILVKKLYEHYHLVYEDLPRDMQKPGLHDKMDNLILKFDYLVSRNNEGIINKDLKLYKYDVFVSHASKDKLKAVNHIREALNSIGVNVWYDDDILKWGDSLEDKIKEGLKECVFGIVVLSKTFFSSTWCNRELEQLIKRQRDNNSKLILPLLFNITVNEAIKRYPELSDIKMIEYKSGMEKDVALLFAEIFIRYLKNGKN